MNECGCVYNTPQSQTQQENRTEHKGAWDRTERSALWKGEAKGEWMESGSHIDYIII